MRFSRIKTDEEIMREVEELDRCYGNAFVLLGTFGRQAQKEGWTKEELVKKIKLELAGLDRENEEHQGIEENKEAEEYECFDPVRDGWINRNTGRP